MDCKVGFIDDIEEMIQKYIKRLNRCNIEVVYAKDCVTYEDIFNWILANQIQYLLVDYNLTLKYEFTGSQLIHYINNKLPDLPCIIFSSVQEINDDLVIRNLIKEKSVLESKFDSPEFIDFIDEMKNGAKVFETRKDKSLEEYKMLLEVKEKTGFKKSEEEDRFIYLYRILSSYGMVDKISPELIKSSVENKIDSLLEKLNEHLK